MRNLPVLSAWPLKTQQREEKKNIFNIFEEISLKL